MKKSITIILVHCKQDVTWQTDKKDPISLPEREIEGGGVGITCVYLYKELNSRVLSLELQHIFVIAFY